MKKVILTILALVSVAGLVWGVLYIKSRNTKPLDPFGYGEVPVHVGETVKVVDLEITLHEVVGDYRCPSDAQCIEAGAIAAQVTFDVGDESLLHAISSDEVPFAFKDYFISITNVEPEVLIGEEIKQEDYIVTFRVEPRNEASNEITWAEAVGIIMSGEWSQIMQLHSKEVMITFPDNREILTREPEIDEVFNIIKECGKRCEGKPIATE